MTTTDPATVPATHDKLADLIGRLADKRENKPVAWNEKLGAWEVFRYEDVCRVLSDPATFSSDLSEFVPDDPFVDKIAKGNLIGMDPPRHRRLRTLVSKAFTPRFVAELEPRIAQVTRELLDAVAGQGRFDLVAGLSYPLPIIVISEMLGIPTSDRDTFREWAEIMLDNEPGEDQTITEAVNDQLANTADTIREMNDYMVKHIEQCRLTPGDDLISTLIAAEMDGQKLDNEEVAWFTALLMLAGHITTTALLSNTVQCLSDSPELAAEVRADRSLVPDLVEEVLRLRPPFTKLARVANREVEIAGVTVPARQIIFCWLAAANRDPALFAEPDALDIHRDPNKQAAFGHGIHFCLGAPLARLEARIAINMVLDRFSDIRVAPDVKGKYFDINALIGAKYLEVDVTTA